MRAFILCLFLAAPLFFSCPALAASASSDCLLLVKNARGQKIFQKHMKDGALFGLRYTHSVALSPVEDFFRLHCDGIWLDKTIYRDFGAGLPTAPEGSQLMRFGNGEIEISGINRKLPEFSLRVGRVAGHVLFFPEDGEKAGNLEIPLDSLAAPGSALTFSAEKSETSAK